MSQWVTLISFNYVHETSVLKSKLESEGILHQIKNEHTLQVHHFLSSAVGGVQVQVPNEDYPRAVALLREMGMKPDLPRENTLLKSLLSFSRKIPFGQMLHPFTKLLLLVLLVISLFVTILLTVVNQVAAIPQDFNPKRPLQDCNSDATTQADLLTQYDSNTSTTSIKTALRKAA